MDAAINLERLALLNFRERYLPHVDIISQLQNTLAARKIKRRQRRLQKIDKTTDARWDDEDQCIVIFHNRTRSEQIRLHWYPGAGIEYYYDKINRRAVPEFISDSIKVTIARDGSFQGDCLQREARRKAHPCEIGATLSTLVIANGTAWEADPRFAPIELTLGEQRSYRAINHGQFRNWDDPMHVREKLLPDETLFIDNGGQLFARYASTRGFLEMRPLTDLGRYENGFIW